MGWENDIKQKLEERRIDPKMSTWERLEANLQEEEKLPFLIYWRISIAAAVLIGAVISGVMINQPTVISNETKMVAKMDKMNGFKLIDSKKRHKTVYKQEINEALHPSALTKEMEIDRNVEMNLKNSVASATQLENFKTKKTVNSNQDQENYLANVTTVTTLEEPILNKGWTVENHSKQKEELDEVDKLLLKAHRKIKVESTFKGSINQVEAADLLQEVNYGEDVKPKRIPELILEGWNYANTLYNKRNQR